MNTDLNLDHVQGDIDDQRQSQQNLKELLTRLYNLLDRHDCKLSLKGFCGCVKMHKQIKELEKQLDPNL